MKPFNLEDFRCAEPVFGPRIGENFPKPEIHDKDMAMRINQAHLANSIRKRPARRLQGLQSSIADGVDGRSGISSFPECIWTPKKLQMHEDALKLTDVSLLLPKGTKLLFTRCTLEAHVNGLRISGGKEKKGLDVNIMFANVSECLLRHQGSDGWVIPPLFLFRLHDPIVVLGNVKTDIQVCLFPVPGNNEKDEQTRNGELIEFARKVEQSHRTCRTEFPMKFQALEECEFSGFSALEQWHVRGFSQDLQATSFFLTKSALLVKEVTPHLRVIPLRKIEIVNLRLRESGIIDMTIVMENFEHVFSILSIPSKFLTDIKHRLNFGEVKFYVNESKIKWGLLVGDIAKETQMFRDAGGWDSLCLEDDLTLAYYPRAYSDSGFQRDSVIC